MKQDELTRGQNSKGLMKQGPVEKGQNGSGLSGIRPNWLRTNWEDPADIDSKVITATSILPFDFATKQFCYQV